jgi:hypothetical protein
MAMTGNAASRSKMRGRKKSQCIRNPRSMLKSAKQILVNDAIAKTQPRNFLMLCILDAAFPYLFPSP